MNDITALLLAGGRSVRFGSDKSRFVPQDGKGDLLQRGLALLGALPGVGRVAVSCREEQAETMVRRLPCGVELVIDQPHERSSPIYGLAAALRRWPGAVLLLSCDMPLMRADLLSRLCSARHEMRAAGLAERRSQMPRTALHEGSAPFAPTSTFSTFSTASTVAPFSTVTPPGSHELPSPLRTAFVQEDGTVETLVSIYEAESLPYLEAALDAGRLGLYAAIPASRQHLLPVSDSRPFLNMNSPEDAELAADLLRGL